MSAWLAIPGQPARGLPTPAAEIEAALAAVTALNAELLRDHPFEAMFGQDFLRASWSDLDGELHTWCDRLQTRTLRYHHTVAWRWSQIWHEAGGWYEAGWHPDLKYHALGQIRFRLWHAVNPHKAYKPLMRQK